MKRFTCLSLFPEIIRASALSSIGGRAVERGLYELEFIQIRDFAVNEYGKVDDALYGGGVGMLMMAEPVFQSVTKAQDDFRQIHGEGREKLIYLSPRGRVLDQQKARELSELDHLILLCGHYEGVDQRVLDECEAEELSIGDYVLTGGELAAAVLIDVISRMLPGVLPSDEAWQKESIASGLLEEPQYTRPAEWRGRAVPELLLSGHAARIEAWRQHAALDLTLKRRPELLTKLPMTHEKMKAWLEAREQKTKASLPLLPGEQMKKEEKSN